MRTIPSGRVYESKIYVDDDKKLILKLDCRCSDFIFKKLQKIGKFADIKQFELPCKHLMKPYNTLIKMGYIHKIPKELVGPTILSAKIRKQLMERTKYKCEVKNCRSTECLEVHRIIRGSNGGKYCLENCQVLCKNCHDLRHANETSANRTN